MIAVNVEEKLVRSFGSQIKNNSIDHINFTQFFYSDEESEILFSKVKKSGTKKESEVLLWDIQKNEANSLFEIEGVLKGIYSSKYVKTER